MAATGTASTAPQRRSSSWHGLELVLRRAAIIFIIISIHSTCAKQLQPRSDLAPKNDTGICGSVDVRNTLNTFRKLEGCRVVEGFVQILLFDNVNETQLSQISFPELTEITDYLLLYRVYGLRSVGQLFPNLSVIRGQVLFFQYSLVIFEMSSLQEIGLYSLTDINHGLIRIDKNPSLCFVNSIDWDLIAHETGDHFIKSLKPPNECPICPGDDKIKEGESGSGSSALSCPKAQNKLTGDIYPRDRHLCWNRQHCQKICPPGCSSCNDRGECCDSNCLGGCSNFDRKDCVVCKNISIQFGIERQCMLYCPGGDFYEFRERRCVTYDECINMPKPINLHSTNEVDFPYKIHGNSCVLQCPPGYMSDNDNHRCIHCQGRCKKECNGVNVDSIHAAKQLQGCTHITTSLEIQIRGGRNVVNELEENLSMIEEINGYLKIVRSFPLVSLNFLKSLKRIHGNQLENDKYAFVVLDNQNLQDLWDWQNDTRTLVIDKGRLFFHFNPKLCLNKIEKLQNITGITNVTDLEVASNSNGDKIACDVENLNVTIEDTQSKGVLLTWQPFQIRDQRKLLGYIVYLIEAKDRNITWYDGRDACGGDGWKVDDVAITGDNNEKITHPLTSLKPYTQYAYYVKTYTIATEKKGAQSDIGYFKTLPYVPSSPLSLQVESYSSDSLNITWKPPQNPNGNVTHYIVAGKKHKNTMVYELNQDYCNSPRRSVLSPTSPVAPPVQPTTTNNDSCACDGEKSQKPSINEAEEVSRIAFEDELQNEVYIKRDSYESTDEYEKDGTLRRKRSPEDRVFPSDIGSEHYNSKDLNIVNATENGTNIWESFYFIVYGRTSFYLKNLHHSTYYDVYVKACREREGENDIENNCSGTSIRTHKTLKKEGADKIKMLQVTNQSLEMVYVTWKEPDDPNGVITSYTIQYKRLDIESSRPNEECVLQTEFLKKNRIHKLEKFLPGNYSLRVMVSTSDGDGIYSEYIYFYIEESSSPVGLTVGLLVTFVFLALIFGYWYYRRRLAHRTSMRLIPSVNPEYVPSAYVADEWEVPRRNITLCRELGQGSFGMVYEGIAKDIRGKPEISCAVKTVNEHATARERLEFLNEASVMKAFDTTHVVRLLGVVSEGQPTLVIMELMANGDLKSYLRSHRPEDNQDPVTVRQPPTLRQIMQMAIEIADGMAYLSAKKFVHRDLAARNCMVSESLTVKIGDFGMTRDIYETDYYRKGTKGLLPVRWMAPESLKDGVFTTHSDVWSYGVVLWEMATLASQPYQGLSNDQVLRYVIDGGVMERPENCPDKLYSLMRFCWQHKPSARPTFLKLCSFLLDDANSSFAQVSFYHSAAGIEARAARPTPSPSQDDACTPLRMASDLDSRFSLNTDSDNEFPNVERQLTFPSISIEGREGLNTANGYVSGYPTNGATTTEC